MFTFKIDRNNLNEKPKGRIIWLHGWGVDHNSLLLMAKYFTDYENVLVDFAGFGNSPPPTKPYGVEDYTKDIYELIKSFDDGLDNYVVGHSFGGRVGIELSAFYPEMVKGLILVAAAGLRKKRSILFKIKAKIIKILAKIFPNMKLGSPDYLKATGIMRQIFVKVINHNQEEIAKNIKCQTLLIYGENDTETPAEFGERFSKIIPSSKLHILKNIGHLSILTDGRFRVQNIIETFLPPSD